MSNHLYRVQILSYPEGATVEYDTDGETHRFLDDEWCPDGWEPTADYVANMGTHRFVWPTVNRTWRSRSSAQERAKLLRSYGATVVVQRSSAVIWPEDGQERVPELVDPRRARAAARALVEALAVA